MIGKIICWMLRAHKWRRLRKGETSYIPASQFAFAPEQHRVCDRCHVVREVMTRKINLEKGEK